MNYMMQEVFMKIELQEIHSYYEDDIDDNLPFTNHEYIYYEKRGSEDILPVFCRKLIGSSIEEIILDFNSEFRERYIYYY